MCLCLCLYVCFESAGTFVGPTACRKPQEIYSSLPNNQQRVGKHSMDPILKGSKLYGPPLVRPCGKGSPTKATSTYATPAKWMGSGYMFLGHWSGIQCKYIHLTYTRHVDSHLHILMRTHVHTHVHAYMHRLIWRACTCMHALKQHFFTQNTTHKTWRTPDTEHYIC